MMMTNAKENSTHEHAPQGDKTTGVKPQRLKLGIDVHWAQYTVVAQFDGASPRPAQRFTPSAFVEWVKEHLDDAQEVHSCYEAGAFGYLLHRKLVALGVRNLVVRPRNWDEYGKKQKTDQRDALALCGMLDRYICGNTEALAVIRVPCEQEEQSRSQTRQRGNLVSDRGRVSNQGLSNARYYGFDLPDQWWRPRAFKRLVDELPAPLYELLGRLQAVLLVFDEQIGALGKLIEAARPEKLPTGMGALTAEVIDREVGDWNRFKNRRQVAGYTGLIPSENSSGEGHKQGSISKHGNPRVRHLLVEAVWRLLQFQPDYKPIKQLLPILRDCKLRGQSARRRKLIVALARLFAIDWWRIRTGRVNPADLGLQMSWPSAAVLRSLNPDAQAAATH